jgi:hypothetical protein
MHAVRTFPPYFPKIHSNIIFPSRTRSSVVSSLQIFCLKFCMHFSSLSHVLHE